MDEPAVRDRRPARGLHRAADLQRQLVEAALPVRRLEPALAREAPQRAVGADVVEPVVVHAGVRQVRRHPLERALASEVEEGTSPGRVELQQRGAELEALRPLGPAAGAIPTVHREHGRAVFGRPPLRQSRGSCGRQLEHPVDFRHQVAHGAALVDGDHLLALGGAPCLIRSGAGARPPRPLTSWMAHFTNFVHGFADSHLKSATLRP